MKTVLKFLIRVYAYILSPLTGPNCRFYPTCSAYAHEAIDRHGAGKGVVLAAKRICKCHPYHKGEMIDPVPASIDWKDILGYKRGSCPCGHPATATKDQSE